MIVQRLFVVALFFVLNVKSSASSGFIEVELLSYSNKKHRKSSDGKCCDIGSSTCRHNCKNAFEICLMSQNTTASKGGVKETDCDYGYFLSPVIQDDDFFFSEKKSLSKPLTFFFNKWKGKCRIKVVVYHIKKVQSNIIANFEELKLPIVSTIYNKSVQQSLNLLENWGKGRRQLEIQMDVKYRLECNKGYIGPDCQRKVCTSQNNNAGHYNCSADGSKICLEGWMDVSLNCTVRNVTGSSSLVVSPSMVSLLTMPSLSTFPTQLQQNRTFPKTPPIYHHNRTLVSIASNIPKILHSKFTGRVNSTKLNILQTWSTNITVVTEKALKTMVITSYTTGLQKMTSYKTEKTKMASVVTETRKMTLYTSELQMSQKTETPIMISHKTEATTMTSHTKRTTSPISKFTFTKEIQTAIISASSVLFAAIIAIAILIYYLKRRSSIRKVRPSPVIELPHMTCQITTNNNNNNMSIHETT